MTVTDSGRRPPQPASEQTLDHVHPLQEGVFLAETADTALNTSLPIDERMVAMGIDKAVILKKRELYDKRSGVMRPHYLVGVEQEGIYHRIWHTDSLDPTSQLMVVPKPGLGELIEDGIGWQLHRELSERLPGASVDTHATQGVGSTARRLGLRELAHHGVDEMADQGLRLLEAFATDKRVFFIGTSMGTIIGNKLLRLNLERGRPVDVAGVIYYAPALVDPANVKKDMRGDFLPQTGKDIVSEIFLKTSFRHLPGQLSLMWHSRPGLRDGLPMTKQALDIMHGTPQAEVEEVVQEYPAWVVTGDRDPVGQLAMWLAIQEEYPSLTVIPIPNRGHGIAVKPYEGGRKLAEIVRVSGAYSVPHMSAA